MYFKYDQAFIDREVAWFEQAAYHRAKLQCHVEQVLRLPLKARKEIYKAWRAQLGDDVARTYAKFAEHVIQKGRPQWFLPELTNNPHLTLLDPSSPAVPSQESCRPSPQDPTPMQPSLL